MSPTVFFILGQTATGKTALAASLAREKRGELVNCDSRQIYQKLDIITGKADNPADLPMHLVNVVDPKEMYSALAYAQAGIQSIDGIISRNKIPVVVGGTGMYARMLLYADLEKADLSIASSLDLSETNKLSKEELKKQLQQVDAAAFEQLSPSDQENPRRLIRAIHKLQANSPEILDAQSPRCIANRFHTQIVVLLHENGAVLGSRIQSRVEERIKSGAIEECQELLKAGYSPTDPGLATIGYQSVFRYLAGVIDLSAMKSEWATRERQYAKRQKTYLLKYFPAAEVRKV